MALLQTNAKTHGRSEPSRCEMRLPPTGTSNLASPASTPRHARLAATGEGDPGIQSVFGPRFCRCWYDVMMGVLQARCFLVGRLSVVRPFGWAEGVALRG